MIKDLFRNVDFLFRMFQETNSSIFVLNEYMTIYDTNIQAMVVTGYGHSEIRDKSFFELLWDEEKDTASNLLLNSFDKRDNINNELFYIKTKDGIIKTLKGNGFIYETDEKTLYYILVTIDVTDKIISEQNEFVEKQKFDSLFNSNGVGIALIDTEANFMTTNKKFNSIFNYSENDFDTMNFDSLFFDDNQFNFDLIKLNLDTGYNQYDMVELKCKTKNNDEVWVSANISKHLDENNDLLYYVFVIQNISDKVYYENKSKESEMKYRVLFEHSFNAIVYKQLIYGASGEIQDYVILDANRAYEAMTGLKRSDILNRPMRIKARNHFHVTDSENYGRLHRYDRILKSGKNIYLHSTTSRTSDKPIDVYYYIVNKERNILAVVFGNSYSPEEINDDLDLVL